MARGRKNKNKSKKVVSVSTIESAPISLIEKYNKEWSITGKVQENDSRSNCKVTFGDCKQGEAEQLYDRRNIMYEVDLERYTECFSCKRALWHEMDIYKLSNHMSNAKYKTDTMKEHMRNPKCTDEAILRILKRDQADISKCGQHGQAYFENRKQLNKAQNTEDKSIKQVKLELVKGISRTM